MKDIVQSPDAATFHVSITPDGPYRVRTLSVSIRRKTKMSPKERELRDSIGRTMRFYEVTHHFDTLPGETAVKISWLEYHDDEEGNWVAAAPEIDVGDQLSSIERGLLMLQEIGKIVMRKAGRANRSITDATFADPAFVLRALRRSRSCTEVELWEVQRRQYWIESVPLRSNEVTC